MPLKKEKNTGKIIHLSPSFRTKRAATSY